MSGNQAATALNLPWARGWASDLRADVGDDGRKRERRGQGAWRVMDRYGVDGRQARSQSPVVSCGIILLGIAE